MKKLLLALGFAAMLCPMTIHAAEPAVEPPPAVTQAQGVMADHAYIPGGTKLKVELIDQVDSKKSKENDKIRFKTSENLILNGVVVIPSGTVGYGYIDSARKPGGFGRKGKVSMQAQEIKTSNDVVVPLISGLDGKGKTDGGAAAVAATVSVIGGLFMKGSGVSYAPGTTFDVEVKNDVDLGCTIENLAAAMSKPKVTGQEIVIGK